MRGVPGVSAQGSSFGDFTPEAFDFSNSPERQKSEFLGNVLFFSNTPGWRVRPAQPLLGALHPQRGLLDCEGRWPVPPFALHFDLTPDQGKVASWQCGSERLALAAWPWLGACSSGGQASCPRVPPWGICPVGASLLRSRVPRAAQ